MAGSTGGVFVGAIASVYVYERTGVNTWGNETEIQATVTEANDKYGHDIAMSGDYLVVGAFSRTVGPSSGAAYIYRRTGGNNWGEELEISDSGSTRFGISVSIDGDFLAVGADLDSGGGSNRGAVYVYERTGLNTWGNATKITASDAADDDRFGLYVSINGDYLVVGAPDRDSGGSNRGAAYVYERTTGNTWTNETILTHSDSANFDNLGVVAIYGDYLVAGTTLKNSNTGAVYVYERTTGNTWTNETKLTASDAAVDDEFGSDIAIYKDHIVVGTQGNGDAPFTKKAYVFERQSGNAWSEVTIFRDPDSGGGNTFGNSVAIDESYIVVGDRRSDNAANNAGTAYVYFCDELESESSGSSESVGNFSTSSSSSAP
jgi:hypothetical protein